MWHGEIGRGMVVVMRYSFVQGGSGSERKWGSDFWLWPFREWKWGLTPSLPWCHLRKRPMKVQNLKPINCFCLIFRTVMWREKNRIETRSIGSRCYRNEKYTVCRRVRASFSPEFLGQWRGWDFWLWPPTAMEMELIKVSGYGVPENGNGVN